VPYLKAPRPELTAVGEWEPDDGPWQLVDSHYVGDIALEWMSEDSDAGSCDRLDVLAVGDLRALGPPHPTEHIVQGHWLLNIGSHRIVGQGRADEGIPDAERGVIGRPCTAS